MPEGAAEVVESTGDKCIAIERRDQDEDGDWTIVLCYQPNEVRYDLPMTHDDVEVYKVSIPLCGRHFNIVELEDLFPTPAQADL